MRFKIIVAKVVAIDIDLQGVEHWQMLRYIVAKRYHGIGDERFDFLPSTGFTVERGIEYGVLPRSVLISGDEMAPNHDIKTTRALKPDRYHLSIS